MMNDYSEIKSQGEMDAFLDRFAGFHDSMAKEFQVLNRGWVNRDRSMAVAHRFDARMFVQMQREPVAVDLLFIDVHEFSAGNPRVCREADGTVENWTEHVERNLITLTLVNSFRVASTRLFYLERPDWYGPCSRLGTEVPHPDCVPAVRLQDQWRQCSLCLDAFEAPDEALYCLCTGCGVLTEFKSGHSA